MTPNVKVAVPVCGGTLLSVTVTVYSTGANVVAVAIALTLPVVASKEIPVATLLAVFVMSGLML